VSSVSVDWSLPKEPHGGRLRQQPVRFLHTHADTTVFGARSGAKAGTEVVFQQAGEFSEVGLPLYGVLRSSELGSSAAVVRFLPSFLALLECRPGSCFAYVLAGYPSSCPQQAQAAVSEGATIIIRRNVTSSRSYPRMLKNDVPLFLAVSSKISARVTIPASGASQPRR